MTSLSALLAEVLARSGQYILGADLSAFGLTMQQFWLIANREITEYQKYIPYAKSFMITTCNQQPYDFTYDPNNLGYNNDNLDAIIYGDPPIEISKLTVTRSIFEVNIMQTMLWQRLGRNIGDPNRDRNPQMLLSKYRKPLLFTTYAGTYDITALYNYFCTPIYQTVNEVNTLTDVTIQGLGDGTNEDPENVEILIEMITGKFLQAIGRSRRAFTHSDLIITTDAAELVTEGTTMYDRARKHLQENCNWFRALKI